MWINCLQQFHQARSHSLTCNPPLAPRHAPAQVHALLLVLAFANLGSMALPVKLVPRDSSGRIAKRVPKDARTVMTVSQV